MDILERIIASKKRELSHRKQLVSTTDLEALALFDRITFSLSQQLKKSSSGIIAEHKRRSPSKAVINQGLSVIDVVKGYEDAGVCGISVLTDAQYFGGSLDDLLLARSCVQLPLLRKEFIIDEYQLLEAKAFGADLILLIAAVLSKEEIRNLSLTAKSLGLEVLLEVHNEEELQKSLMPSIDLFGVNNRNLKTFEVDLETSKALAPLIPDSFTKVSESGISKPKSIRELKEYGYQGFLVGENFMKTNDPGLSAGKFIKQIEG